MGGAGDLFGELLGKYEQRYSELTTRPPVGSAVIPRAENQLVTPPVAPKHVIQSQTIPIANTHTRYVPPSMPLPLPTRRAPAPPSAAAPAPLSIHVNPPVNQRTPLPSFSPAPKPSVSLGPSNEISAAIARIERGVSKPLIVNADPGRRFTFTSESPTAPMASLRAEHDQWRSRVIQPRHHSEEPGLRSEFETRRTVHSRNSPFVPFVMPGKTPISR